MLRMRLFRDQENYLGIVLHHVLENSYGQFLLARHKDNPRKVWLRHREHQCNSETSMKFAQKLLVKIYGLQIKNFPSRLDFLTEWSILVARHADVSDSLNNPTLSGILQLAIRADPAMLTMFSNF